VRRNRITAKEIRLYKVMKSDPIALQNWHRDRGDYTHNVNYQLTNDSVVVDLGGFRGVWADMLLQNIAPVTPKIILVEPVPEFFNYLVDKFKDRPNIKVLSCGVSTNGSKASKNIYVSSDGSSTQYECGPSAEISTVPIEDIIADYQTVDLIQINIEGDEYALMEYMLDSGAINRFKNLQIQYHLGIENDRARRDSIQQRLISAGFIRKFDYPFVWEGWTKPAVEGKKPEEYIYCRLKGGLGNMMFQMAAAKAFALDAGCECSFPNLNAQLKLLDDDNFYNPSLKHSSEYMKIFHKLKTVQPLGSDVKYEGFPFEYEARSIAPNSILDGFFQSEKYFGRHRQAVLDIFDFSFISDEYIKTKYPFIGTKRTTSIHVRRGDYLKNPFCHQPLSMLYYIKAMERLKDKTDVFVVFSDDIEWCKQNFSNAVFIENEKDYVEVYLMSLCDNHIISNSSFSWWGAWMNKNENKTVIGPQIWFGPGIGHRTSDILPDNWIKI